jgi:hypothetical protein
MTPLRLKGLTIACALGLVAISAGAHADGGRGLTWRATSEGSPVCPGISWHFRAGVDEPYGYMWFNDVSGVSRASGTLNKATGAMRLNVVSLSGKGPAGVIDAVKAKDGSVTGTLKGEGCSNLTISAPVIDADDIGNQK